MLKLIVVALMCVVGAALAEQSPVLVWNSNSVAAHPALQAVAESRFEVLVNGLLQHHDMVLAFTENGLTSQDFLCSDDDSQSCYSHLSSASQKTYLARVENPSEVLRAVGGQHVQVDKAGELASPLKCDKGTVSIVSFEQNSASSRSQTLKSHDAIIADIADKISASGCSVAFIYTGSGEPAADAVSSRVRRSTAATTGGYLFQSGNQFLLFFTQLTLVNSATPVPTTEDIVISTMSVANSSATQFTVTLTAATGKALSFNVALSGGYYQMSAVAYDGISFRSTDVNAPTDFAYFCGNLTLSGITKTTDTTPNPYSLVWNSLQFQAPFDATTPNNFVFGDAWHCVGFFTPGILSGLFVVILMLAITFTGVCWMMDINTMDRFDDPKGKTITINASE